MGEGVLIYLSCYLVLLSVSVVTVSWILISRVKGGQGGGGCRGCTGTPQDLRVFGSFQHHMPFTV